MSVLVHTVEDIVGKLRDEGFNIVLTDVPIGISKNQIIDTFEKVGVRDCSFYVTGKQKIFGLKINQSEVRRIVGLLQGKVFSISGKMYPIMITGFNEDKSPILVICPPSKKYKVDFYNIILFLIYVPLIYMLLKIWFFNS